MGVSIFSYAGAVTVGLQTATALIPDPETILEAFREELAEVERLARTPTPGAAGTSYLASALPQRAKAGA